MVLLRSNTLFEKGQMINLHFDIAQNKANWYKDIGPDKI